MRRSHPSKGEHMTCKHRWEESQFGIRWRTPDHIMYECTRCHKIISTYDKRNEDEQVLQHGQGEDRGVLHTPASSD
jgi:hypothetical protein